VPEVREVFYDAIHGFLSSLISTFTYHCQ
jgi:hypothetical protein